MKHWHWDKRKEKPIRDSHEGGHKKHSHPAKGWVNYGRTKKLLLKAIK